jgi:hypothetical protein
MIMQLFVEGGIMTQCQQGKPTASDEPRCYLTFVCGNSEFQATAYGTVEQLNQPPVPLNYTLDLSSRLYSNNTILTIESMKVDDPFGMGAYYVKTMKAQSENGKK